MLKMLSSFAALSICAAVVMSLLPEGGLKRTAGMAVGLLTLLCWAQGVTALLQLKLPEVLPSTALAPTAYSIEEASAALALQWAAAE